MREEVEGLLELNNKLIKKQEFKDKELLTYRKKLKSQREEIKVGEQDQLMRQEWEQKYKQLEKEHINEIAILKSNLNNSIIFEEEEEKKDQVPVYSFSQNESNLIEQLKEENKMLKEQIQSGELKDKIGYIEMSLNESLKKLEQENMQLKQIIDLGNLEEQKLLQSRLESIEIPGVENDSSVLHKMNGMINWIQEMELELEEWKRNYWILEKKINHYELKEEQFNSKNDEEIEIEYDFTNNQIMQTTKQNTQNTLQDQLDECIEQNKKLVMTIKKLEQQLNDKENKQEQESKKKQQHNKDLLQKLITSQRKQMSSTYFVRGYTRPQIIPPTRISPLHAPLLNLTSHSPLSKNYYTPIIIKQSSQSPVHYKNY